MQIYTPPACSLCLFRPLWCVASRTEKTTRHITIPLFSDGNNYIFCRKQPKMHTNTYFAVSPEPQITPESYLARSRVDAGMIYSGGHFLMSGHSLGDSHAVRQIHIRKLKPELWGDITRDRMSELTLCFRKVQDWAWLRCLHRPRYIE